jgi:hypothetical protein
MSILDGIKKGEDFQVPAGYFDKLPDAVFAKIKKEETVAQRKRISFTISSIAASLLLLLGIVGLIRMEKQENLQSAHNTITNSSLPAVDTLTLRNYLAMNETLSEMTDQMEAMITDEAPKPVYASERELASVEHQLDESDYRIMEYYADEIDADSNF